MSEFKPGDEVAVRAVVLGEVAELPDGSVLNAMLGRVPECCGREMFGPVGGGARGAEAWWCPDCHRRVPVVAS